jgi:predicted esterase
VTGAAAGTVPPSDRTALVLLHGGRQGPGPMQELAARLGPPTPRCLTPAAPGGSWFPHRFVGPRAPNEPMLGTSVARVHAALDELAARGFAPERTVLAGFSQGACLACHALAVRPRPLGALVALSGGLIGLDDEVEHPAPRTLTGCAVLLTGTDGDPWIPVERVRRTGEVLRAAGAEVDFRIHPPAPHGVHDAEIAAFRLLLRRLGGSPDVEAAESATSSPVGRP